ncbi:hypothetical protein [Anabaena azotica]|uniref:hypothetical protein n=1 Tax=Anabaena azotica TaxID=197653 RepID=UPI001684F6E3|nr:hypothetical protein [Anabaena azotica]
MEKLQKLLSFVVSITILHNELHQLVKWFDVTIKIMTKGEWGVESGQELKDRAICGKEIINR